MKKTLTKEYESKKAEIQNKLKEFKHLQEEAHFSEMLFCLLTPQSNAKRCWEAVIELRKKNTQKEEKIRKILKTKTRFHNNKSRYIVKAFKQWKTIVLQLDNPKRIELRNWLADNVSGFGLKEASHFLRNIGKSENQIAILDRHILRNLKELKIIKDEKIKNKKHYLDIEEKFLAFSSKMQIPIDELDLLFWGRENGEIFK